MKKLCIIGSINMDLVARVDRFPNPGETIRGLSFGTFPGGKGANQAVAAARLGADVLMVGKVGDDLYGSRYLEVFHAEGVRTECVGVETAISTGVAVIEVDRTSENHIVIVAGANGRVDRDFLSAAWERLAACDLFLLQLEVPIETVLFAAERLRRSGKTVILDPAPAAELPAELYRAIDYLTPNEHELAALVGAASGAPVEAGIERLLRRGVGTVIVKVGRDGAYLGTAAGIERIAGFSVDVVDTTAAGDSFNAGLAFALAEGRTPREAVCFANAVGALSTTALGAQGAMPRIDAVRRLLSASGRE